MLSLIKIKDIHQCGEANHVYAIVRTGPQEPCWWPMDWGIFFYLTAGQRLLLRLDERDVFNTRTVHCLTTVTNKICWSPPTVGYCNTFTSLARYQVQNLFHFHIKNKTSLCYKRHWKPLQTIWWNSW